MNWVYVRLRHNATLLGTWFPTFRENAVVSNVLNKPHVLFNANKNSPSVPLPLDRLLQGTVSHNITTEHATVCVCLDLTVVENHYTLPKDKKIKYRQSICY